MPCTLCKQAGHNKRTCRNKKADPKAPPLPAPPAPPAPSMQSCCICMEDLQADGKNVCTTKCGHTFCFDCMAQSINANNNACPLCRCELVKRRKVAPRLHDIQSVEIMDTITRESGSYNEQLADYKKKIKVCLENAINTYVKKHNLENIKKSELNKIYNQMERKLIIDFQKTLMIYGLRCINYTEAYYRRYI